MVVTSTTRPSGIDIPGIVVISFVLALTGFALASIANLIVGADMLTSGAERDLTEAAAPTVLGLAVSPALGALGGIVALATTLRRQRLGRSLAWGSVVVGMLAIVSLIGYAAQLQQVESELDELLAETPMAEVPTGPSPTEPTTSVPEGTILSPEAGRWVTVGGVVCPFVLEAPEGGTWDEGEGDFVDVPELTVALHTDPGCEWERAG